MENTGLNAALGFLNEDTWELDLLFFSLSEEEELLERHNTNSGYCLLEEAELANLHHPYKDISEELFRKLTDPSNWENIKKGLKAKKPETVAWLKKKGL